MLLSLSRRLLALLLALGVLGFSPVSAYDSDYEEEEQEVRKSKKKSKKKKKKQKDEDDYWDEDSWEDDEVEPVVKKKKKKKSKKKKSKKKKKKSEEEDSWDDWDSWDEDDADGGKSSDDEEDEDFFADDEPEPVKPRKVVKTAMGNGAKNADEPRKAEPPKPVAQPKPQPEPKPVAQPKPQPGPKHADPRQECVRKLIAGSSDMDYVELRAVHPGWQSTLRVCKDHELLVNLNHSRDVATVLVLTERELRVKWDNWGEERFLRQADNSYMLDSMVKRSGSSLSRKASRAAKRLRSRKAVPWEEYGWTGWIMDYISGNEPPLTYKTFKLVNEQMDCKVRFSEEEKVLVRMDGGHEPAVVLGYTGVKLHVRWESGAVETYRRMEDGSYRKIDDERVARQLLDPNISTREKSEDDWFQIWWRDITNEEKPLTYVNVEMKKGNVEYRPRLSMDNLVLIQLPPHQGWAKVIKFDRRQLIIRWNGVTEELYERDDENVYHFVK